MHPTDTITIAGLEAFGHHGVLPHERRYGQRFLVDVSLHVELGAAALSDDLRDTIDYGSLSSDIVGIVSGEPANLIETVAARIAERCLDDPRVSDVEVTVHKPCAPLPVVARDVAVTLRRVRA